MDGGQRSVSYHACTHHLFVCLEDDSHLYIKTVKSGVQSWGRTDGHTIKAYSALLHVLHRTV